MRCALYYNVEEVMNVFDQIAFGEKLQRHRRLLGLTQNDVAEAINVSPQAVSKWENGDCLPDCYNLKQLGQVYGVSLDILLDMDHISDLSQTSKRIEQLATEYIWAVSAQDDYSNESLGNDLWELVKSIYYIEVGNRELQQSDKEMGKIRYAGPYGLKMWDNDGIHCTITQKFASAFSAIDQESIDIIRWILSPEIFAVIVHLKSSSLLTKQELTDITGISTDTLSLYILELLEKGFIEYIRDESGRSGYRLGDNKGIIVWLLLSAVCLTNRKDFIMSRYKPLI